VISLISIDKENLDESYSSTGRPMTISLYSKGNDIQISTIEPESISTPTRLYQLNFEIGWMKNRIKDLENQVSLLEEIIEGPFSEIKVINVRETTIEEAKKMIYQYYESHDTQSIYPSEAADELNLDLETAVKAIDELLEEGKLEVVSE
jgi:hypothetical protein